MRTSRFIVVASVAWLAGCAAPWTPSFVAGTRQAEGIAVAADDAEAKAGVADSPGLSKAQSEAHPPSAETAFAEVLDELREIGAMDPDAEREVIASLKAAKPEHYSLIVGQYKAALSYRKQLAQRDSERAQRQREQAFEERSLATMPHMRTPRQEPAVAAGEVVLAQRTTDAAAAALANDPNVTLASDEHDAALSALRAAAVQVALAQREQAPQMESLPPPPLELDDASPPPRRLEATPVVQASYNAAERVSPLKRGDWKSELDATIHDLESSVSAAPSTVDEVHDHMRLRTLQLLAGRQEEALRPIPGASSAQQDYWAKQLFAMSAFLDASTASDEKSRAAATLAHLSDARDRLSEIATLQVRNAAFVTRVDGFGLYETAKETKFAPGAAITLYAEIDNFRSRSTAEGFETSLGTSYQVVDASGRRVDGAQFPDVQDVCQSRRHDFHMQYAFDLPTRIYPGPYTLQVIVTDHLSNKIGQADLAFEIVDGPGR